MKSLVLKISAVLVFTSCQTVREPRDSTPLASRTEFLKLCESDPDFLKGVLLATNTVTCQEALMRLDLIQAGTAEFDPKFEQVVGGAARKM